MGKLLKFNYLCWLKIFRMKNLLKLLLLFTLSTVCISNILAVRATPYPITVTQPDGTKLTIYLRGDEFFHYKTTLDGYTLTTNSEGILTYANMDVSGNLVNSNVKASNIEKRTAQERRLLTSMKQNINFSKIVRQKRIMRTPSNAKTYQQKSYPLTGSPKSLVILVNFSDLNYVVPKAQTAFTNLLNQKGYSTNFGTGSAKDYFRDNSMGVFNPQFDVVGPYKLPQTMDYYGKNDASGNDTNPQQMVIDACTLASVAGIDFSQYDTDRDGSVDNVFIYYAGYNEAEGGPANSVWPHRWSLANRNTRFNGVAIFDYACTSELRGKTGSNMCGIGTFVHEFGHVLGLPDYYPTNTASHHTLSYWNVMDAGPYLNSGRTPPAYSAFDRFYLNWLKPTELKVPGKYSLENLTTSNKAYLITQYGNHNLNGANPSPVEFFTLENRQKSGWDTYLPGHGMLITRIYYNATDWNNNEPNNNPNAMGVDIIEADGLASDYNLPGDPFPGSTFINSYKPTLRSGIELSNKPLLLITETNGIITFGFISNGILKTDAPRAIEATDVTIGSFISNWDKVTNADGYYLTVYNISNGTSQLTEGFDQGVVNPIGWKVTASKRTTSTLYSGIKVPAVQFSFSTDTIVSEEYILPVVKLTFYIRSLGGLNGFVRLEGKNESSWNKIDSIPINSLLNEIKSYTFENLNYKQFRLTYKKVIGDVAIDDITAHFGQNLQFNKHEVWTTANSDTLMNLISNHDYFYKVRASQKLLNQDQSILYENYSDFSNIIQVNTLENKPGNIFRIQNDGSVKMLIPTNDLIIRVYNVLGQLIREITPQTNVFKIDGLKKGQLYIIEAGEFRAKIIL